MIPLSIVHEFLPSSLADRLAHWLVEYVPWHIETTEFYQHSKASLHGLEGISPLVDLLAHVPNMLNWMDGAFDCTFEPRFDAWATRLDPRQGIGVHSDFMPESKQTHRIILDLQCIDNRIQGGDLVFLNSLNPQDISRVVPFRHNQVVAFELSPRSLHAVSEVRCGIRLSIVFEFARKRAH